MLWVVSLSEVFQLCFECVSNQNDKNSSRTKKNEQYSQTHTNLVDLFDFYFFLIRSFSRLQNLLKLKVCYCYRAALTYNTVTISIEEWFGEKMFWNKCWCEIRRLSTRLCLIFSGYNHCVAIHHKTQKVHSSAKSLKILVSVPKSDKLM